MLRILHNCRYQYLSRNLSYSVEDDYKAAVTALNLLQSNKQTLADPKTRQFPESKRHKVIDFLSKCGIDINTLEQKLSVIHVSGTKGKGSTCAFCESILRQHGYKTGFFSSPHLVSVRERFKINGQSISQRKFTTYFWEVYQKLSTNESQQSEPDMPPYFMFLTVMAFKIFIEEKVQVAIIEVGIGGEYDCTNILGNTAVVGVSSLGYDHIALLGKSIEEISWQKAGIMKPNCIAITTSDQPAKAMEVLKKRAEERKCALFVAPKLEEYDCNEKIILGNSGPAQPINASLAMQLANAWMYPFKYKNNLCSTAPTFPLCDEIFTGLKNCRWPGRTQIIKRPSELIYYLDGAHNLESIQLCVEWFLKTVPPHSKKALIFNMIGDRDPGTLMKHLIRCNFDYAFFCPNVIGQKDTLTSDFASLKNTFDEEYAQSQKCHKHWLELNENFNDDNAKCFRNVGETFRYIEENLSTSELNVLITGSLHLVGAFLSILDPELKYSEN
ncbi:folylpolyglutamate synthase, mitochondrial-like [Planococcus citri]|uniref:folylpolyglutamate synthase, mitochondrial-like n=1 Tax=Planococcus citri TaxID=170843 RepID=UPI0031F8BE59